MLEALVRAHKAKSADYDRVILYRTGSNFDRGPPNVNDLQHFLDVNSRTELAKPAIENLFVVGEPVVKAVRCFYSYQITGNWSEWEKGVKRQNSSFYGDVFGTLRS